MPFIRQVRVAEPGTHAEHVVEVRYSTLTTGRLRSASREQVYDAVRAGTRFRTVDEVTHNQADVVARVSTRGTRYVATVANGRETDNILHLPRY
ncbi:DUF3892 domain-containing protein [Cellulosimicrobium arenosum]|uniref:DUF3892 domain-containing protein n=1 Tax=Cellulosimicrobium arenosum TaxID=2708133 RepID=A0A927IZ71_9MICO|nr:DUF3892 domain-containing protein [Cellulosimicrobium arenosum]MBD8078174.1 DUF3892 domain-containing protein [Cellulosimicrobium arenosum]